MYKVAREQAGLSQFEAAGRINVSTRALAYYEAKERPPAPDVVLKMSQVYRQPELIVRYCRECPIGQAYNYDILDNVDKTLTTVIAKLITELKEAIKAAEVLLELSINKKCRKDFTNDEWLIFLQAVGEFIDVEHNVEFLKLVLEELTEEVGLVPEIVARHNQKCRDKGYIKEKAPSKNGSSGKGVA